MTQLNTPNTPNILILYHAKCLDGAGALYVAVTALQAQYPNARIVSRPCEYNDRDRTTKHLLQLASLGIPLDTYDHIYVLDFSFTPEQFKRLCTISTEVTCIDHHKTACDELLYPGNRDTFPKNLHLILDTDNRNSGVILTFSHFTDLNTNNGAALPSGVLRYIEDRDLWKFQLPESRAVNAWLHAYVDIGTESQQQLVSDVQFCIDTLEMAPWKIIKEGQLLLAQREDYCAAIASTAMIHTEAQVITCNCPHVFASDVAELLRKRYPNMAMFMLYQVANGELRVSFRAGTKDVLAIAQCFGGGGHAKAAGATVSVRSWFEYLEEL